MILFLSYLIQINGIVPSEAKNFVTDQRNFQGLLEIIRCKCFVFSERENKGYLFVN